MKYYIMLLLTCVVVANNQYPTQEQLDKMLHQAFELVWQEAMKAKQTINNTDFRSTGEELLSNLSSSAPAVNFVTHADLGESLTSAENTSASIFVSMDNQTSWFENDYVVPIDAPGYENTWGATTITGGGNSVDWYLSGSIDSGALGLNLGQVTVSQSPFNGNNSWPPSNNLYALITTDVSGDATSGQDITNIRATYSDDRLYASMELNNNCCDEGGFFGPWYLYAIAVVNPDALENGVAYAYAYGDGGFGELYPGIYKIYGDYSNGLGAIDGFEVLSTNFNYSTSGNQLQASSLLSIITNDTEWGVWPNSLNGVALVGATVEAGLSGLDVEITEKDNSDIGVLVLSTQSQDGNVAPVLTNPLYENNTLSVTYSDADGNLAVAHDVFIEGDMAFTMVPESHAYLEGAIFTLSDVSTSGIVTFSFYDGKETVLLDFDLGGGSCALLGDANGDGVVNVIDIVLTVNLILCNDCPDNYNICSDLNMDEMLNVLDIVALVNLILGS